MEEKEGGASKGRAWPSMLFWALGVMWVGSAGWGLIRGDQGWKVEALGAYVLAGSGFIWAIACEYRYGLVSHIVDAVSRFVAPYSADEREAASESVERQAKRAPWLHRVNQGAKRYESAWMMAGVLIVPLVTAIIAAVLTAVMAG